MKHTTWAKQALSLLLVATMLMSLNWIPRARAHDMGKTGWMNTISVGAENQTATIKTDGSLWMWGQNNYGQLGMGDTENRLSPVKVLDNVTSICAGESHTAAIRTDGSLWMWGRNNHGQLGTGDAENRLSPVKVLDDVVAVSVDGMFTAAIRTDGSLWMWGSNYKGQLGTGDKEDHYIPARVLGDVVAVSAGEFVGSYKVAAIRNDGSLWMWGDEVYADGHGNRFIDVPVKIMDNVAAVSTSGDYTAAIRTDRSLWIWGTGTSGKHATGDREDYHVPAKMLDDVMAVSAGEWHVAAIRTDGSLWMWGDNSYSDGWYYHVSGLLGTGDSDTGHVTMPVKVLDDVAAVSAGEYNTAAVRMDGSLWTWGLNYYGGLGMGDRKACLTPAKIMDGVKLPNGTMTQQPTADASEYIYDTEDPGESVVLDVERLKTVTDAPSAAAAVRDQVKSMTSAQKESATGTDLATLYAETAASKVASKTVSGNEIVINKAAATELTANSNEALKAVETELSGGGITTDRELSCAVTFRTNATGEITVRVEPDVLTAEADRFIVETPTYALTLRAADLKDTLSSGAVVIRAQDVGPYAIVSHSMILASAGGSIPMAGGMTVYESPVTQNTVYAAANGTTQVKLTLPAGFSEPVTLSMPGSAAQDTTVKDSTGAAAPSKYNPATARVDSWVNASGTYAAQSNEKDFVDIANKSAEMQRAIRYLASRGIINGTDETHFNPDGSITRAEIAALLVRTLGRLDKNAKPTFTDVKSSNWYYATAASSQKAGLIKGYEDNTFRGGNQINKEQIVAVSARVLTKEMGYKTPSNTASYLKKYSDSVVEWARPEVALATKENLVVYRKDGTFRGGAGMTRGDAAIIIYRVFMKIW